MSNIAVDAVGIGKRYRIGSSAARSETLREALLSGIRAPFRNLAALRSLSRFRESEEANVFWALRDVSFQVERGEVLGIIGRNGAGKSTLLKVLSRITEPTTGHVDVRGRVGALLEVGTGFHGDLTGRQNVYLNGSILGMDRGYIDGVFDQIVDFAGVEKYIDTPVKRYSSGMYLRLAFAVAAHMEPEILIVDEVLAVGDAQFQKKCLGKMNEVARDGRTVLFVSHNMAAVENLCQRAVVLSHGSVDFVGSQRDAIRHYLRSSEVGDGSLRNRIDRMGTGAMRLTQLEIRDSDGHQLDVASCGQDLEVCLHYEIVSGDIPGEIIAAIQVRSQFDMPVFQQHNRLTGQQFGRLPQHGMFVCRIPRIPLAPSTYRVTCSLSARGEVLDLVEDALSITVVAGDFFSSGEVPPDTHGCSLVDADWRLEPNAVESLKS
jgi:lipopolysaccharide transport system ATP-binding protein